MCEISVLMRALPLLFRDLLGGRLLAILNIGRPSVLFLCRCRSCVTLMMQLFPQLPLGKCIVMLLSLRQCSYMSIVRTLTR